MWQKFADWCNGRQIDPIRPAVTQVADYLMYLFSVKQFSPRSIGLYRTAVASTIKNSGGEDFGHNAYLSAMIRGFMIQRPPKRKLVPQWSLTLVLRRLREAPF